MKKAAFGFLAILILWAPVTTAAPRLHEDVFGKSLGGWTAKKKRAADYELSGSSYRTWKPEVTPLVTGGIYISVRIDYRRGLFSSDDHANLELTVDQNGNVVSARSSLALQGKRVTSDLIRSTGTLGTKAVGIEGAAKIGVDLVSDLSQKIMRENITEPGRVTFPAVVQHNYNLLCLSIGNDDLKAVALDENGRPIELAGPKNPHPPSVKPEEPRKAAPLNGK